MPTSDQHAQRVKQAQSWLNQLHDTSACFNPAVTEYFYAVLHMFEAAVYDFPNFADNERHFFSHKQRTDFLSGFVRDPKNPLRAIAPYYESLRQFSERGRYLSPARMFQFQPLKPSDVPKAKQLYDKIKMDLEVLYGKQHKAVPWVTASPPASVGVLPP